MEPNLGWDRRALSITRGLTWCVLVSSVILLVTIISTYPTELVIPVASSGGVARALPSWSDLSAWLVVPKLLAITAWVYGVTRLCKALGLRLPRTTPLRDALGWVVPPLSLFRPYQIMKGLRRATEPPRVVSGDWMGQLPWLVRAWWWGWWLDLSVGLYLGFRAQSLVDWKQTVAVVLFLVIRTCVAVAEAALGWSIQARLEVIVKEGPLDADNADEDDEAESPVRLEQAQPPQGLR